MTAVLAPGHTKAKLLALLQTVPSGAVVTVDLLAQTLGIIPTLVATVIANLSGDEREATPWHRVVAKGGAIGRGPNRDQQFAQLIREGVCVSPAGVVQDMARVAVTGFDGGSATIAITAPNTVRGRSRGMKDRPA